MNSASYIYYVAKLLTPINKIKYNKKLQIVFENTRISENTSAYLGPVTKFGKQPT